MNYIIKFVILSFGVVITSCANQEATLYNSALKYYENNDIEEAEKEFRKLVELNQSHALALNALAYINLENKNNINEALELATRAEKIAPSNPRIQDTLGWLYFKKGDLAESQRYIERSYSQFKHAEVAAHLGELYWALDKKSKAVGVWNEAKQSDPENESLKNTMARFGLK